MITKITAANAAKYQILFKDASIALNLWDTSNDAPKVDSDPMASSISTLEQYFAHLKALSNENKKYIKLPLDEETFDIDANTRAITVPLSFRNGIAVQGDELAEIIYFKIDRYFDAIDLDTMDIAIQWTNAANESGISKEFFSDIFSEEGKIIFGWPISNAIANTPGIVKFSVRFYKLRDSLDANQGFLFNFNTLPATVIVNNSLDFDLSQVQQENLESQIVDRVVSSDFSGLIVANTPYFYNPSTQTNVQIDSVLPSIREIEDGDMAVMACSEDAGTITYYWYYRPDNESTYHQVSKAPTYYNLFKSAASFDYDTKVVYYESKETASLEGYDINGNLMHFSPTLVTEDSFNTRKGSLYLRFSAYKVNEGAGQYIVAAENQVYGDRAVIRSNICNVYGPQEFTIMKQAPKQFEIYEDRTNEGDTNGLFIGHDSGNSTNNVISYKVQDVEKNTDTYQWYKGTNAIPGATSNQYKIEEEGTYTCKVHRERNGSSIDIVSDEILAVYRPKRIAQKVSTSSDVAGYYYDGEATNASGDAIVNNTTTLRIVVVPPEELMAGRAVPELSYQWYMVYTSDGGRSPISGATTGSINPSSMNILNGTVLNCDITCTKGGFSSYVSTTKKITVVA